MARQLLRDRAPADRVTRRIRNPKPLPEGRGTQRKATYDESRAWLWAKLQAGDRGVASALMFHFSTVKPKGLPRLPWQLDRLAVDAAARWVLANWESVNRKV